MRFIDTIDPLVQGPTTTMHNLTHDRARAPQGATAFYEPIELKEIGPSASGCVHTLRNRGFGLLGAAPPTGFL